MPPIGGPMKCYTNKDSCLLALSPNKRLIIPIFVTLHGPTYSFNALHLIG